MQTYIGTKIVKMRPMTRAEYNEYRGWAMPPEEKGTDEGYLVEYTDGGSPNDGRHDGYITWTPKAAADAAYRLTGGLNFGLAIEAAKKGHKIARAGWNGAMQFVYYVPANRYPATTAAAKGWFGVGSPVPYNAYLALKTVQDTVSTWVPSITDVLADDWAIWE